MNRFRRVISANPLMSLSFAAAAIALIWFAFSFLADALFFNDPKHRNQAIEPWMTPRYVSRSWRVPPEELRPLLGLPKGPIDGRPPTMGQIATELGISLDELETRISEASQALKEGRGGPKND